MSLPPGMPPHAVDRERTRPMAETGATRRHGRRAAGARRGTEALGGEGDRVPQSGARAGGKKMVKALHLHDTFPAAEMETRKSCPSQCFFKVFEEAGFSQAFILAHPLNPSFFIYILHPSSSSFILHPSSFILHRVKKALNPVWRSPPPQDD